MAGKLLSAFFISLLMLVVSLIGSHHVFAVPEKSSAISSEEFLSGDFSTYFKQAKYVKALAALDGLLAKYPNDPLILRYKALTLQKLGHRQEAIATYQHILAMHPNHAPTHLFLGLAYAKAGRRHEAADQFRWVVQHGDSDAYRHWAQAQLTRVRESRRMPARPIQQKPYLLGKTRLAYDSNPLLIPDDQRLSSRDREGTLLFGLDLDIGYPLVLQKDRRVDVMYLGRQTFHGPDADEVDFTSQGAALAAKQRRLIGSHAVVFGQRYDVRANFLQSALFSVIHRILVSAETSFWNRTKTHVYSRLSYSNYGPDGRNPDVTSRDGMRGGLGIIQSVYTADRQRYVFAKEEVSFADTRGDNYRRTGSLTRLGVHAPVKGLGPTDVDASIGFDWGAYPDFSSFSLLEPEERRDARMDTYVSMTYHWKPNVATRAFYRFIHAENQNDFFDRQRHIAGVEMVFSL